MQIEFNGQTAKLNTLFSKDQIQARIEELAKKINQEYGPNELLVVLIVLNGGFIFAADLVRYFEMPTEIETIRLKSYEGVKSTGKIKLVSPLTNDLKDKHVLIIEDIVETGKTLEFLEQHLQSQQVKSVKICTLLNKPEAHEVKLKLDYIGFDIGKNFVIGYGLDLDGKYRNMPFIGELVF